MIRVVDGFFDKIDSAEKAYTLGFILADGHINIHGRMWSISNTDRRVIDYIHSLVGGSILLQKKYKSNHKQGYALYVCRKHQVKKLKNLGLEHDKSYTAKWPTLIPELEPHLLRGYLDGDGYLSKKLQRVTAVSASKNLMRGFAKAVGKITGKVPRIAVVKTTLGTAGLNFVVGIFRNEEVKTLLQEVYGDSWGLKSKRAKEMISKPSWDHRKSGLKAYQTSLRNFSKKQYFKMKSKSAIKAWQTRRRLQLKS